MNLSIGVAERPKLGQAVSGDTYVIKNGGPTALIAVIDGLGGGAPAAEAALKASTAIAANATQPLSQIMRAAHQACLGSRGAVIGLLRLDLHAHHASYVGVGNIGVHVVSQYAIRPLSKNGIVGYRLPTLAEQQASYAPGDTFILFSDGISGRFADAPVMRSGLEPQPLADRILEEYGKTIDDVTVVVIKTDADQC